MLHNLRFSKAPKLKALFYSLSLLVANQLHLLIFPFPVAVDGACSDGIELAIHCHRIGSSVMYGQQIVSTWAWKFHLFSKIIALETERSSEVAENSVAFLGPASRVVQREGVT